MTGRRRVKQLTKEEQRKAEEYQARKDRADREAKSREDWWRIFELPEVGHSSADSACEKNHTE